VLCSPTTVGFCCAQRAHVPEENSSILGCAAVMPTAEALLAEGARIAKPVIAAKAKAAMPRILVRFMTDLPV
jgi:hypothetical protein